MENEELSMTMQIVEPLEQPKLPLHKAVFAWGTFALGFILTHLALPYFGGLWGGILWAVFGIFIAVYAKLNAVRFTKFHVAMLSAAELFCLTPLFSANRLVCFLAAVYSFALYLYLMTTAAGAEPFGRHFVRDFFHSVLVRPFESFFRQPVCAFSVFKGRSKNLLYAFLGLLIALPLTAVVLSLLISSDDAFGNVMKGFTALLPRFSLTLVCELLLAVPIAMYLFGALFSVKDPVPESFGVPEYRILPPVISYFAISPICLFYLIYVIVQVGNIANAFSGNIAYAEFARRGFFELCAIAVIDLGVIAALQTFSKRNVNDKKPLALRIYTVIISAFTLMIIATALTKMFMYIGEYGMTPLRVYTSWFMVLLAVIFTLITVNQIRDFTIWKPLFAAFSVLFAALCFGNFEGNIAAYNIAAYQSGALAKLDVEQLEELGTAAVYPAYKLYRECDDETLKDALGRFIENESFYDRELPRFAYFSVPRALAWSAFDEPELTAGSLRVGVYLRCDNVYGVGVEYLLDGVPVGGQEVMCANGSMLRGGEEIVFEFTERDLGYPDDISDKKFALYFYFYDQFGREIIPLVPGNSEGNSEEDYSLLYSAEYDAPLLEWNPRFGEEYKFILRENENEYYIYPAR